MLLGEPALNHLIEDAQLYWNGAQYWLDSGFFAVPGPSGYVAHTERTPFYFIFLLPFRWMSGDSVTSALIAQTLIDSGTCVVIARIGAMIGRATGIVAGLFAATWINLIIHSSLILTDTLFVFFASLVLLFAAKYVDRGRILDIGLAGFFCGIAIVTRPVALFLPLAMAIAAPLISRHRGRRWIPGVAGALVMLTLAMLPATPIIHRNLTQFGTPQLTTQSGPFLLFWVAGIPKTLATGKRFGTVTAELNSKLSDRLEQLENSGIKLNVFQRSQQLVALARDELKAMPVGTVLYGWFYGAGLNLAAPALLQDQRVHALNQASFHNAVGIGFVDRAANFLRNNDLTYVFWLGVGCVGAVIALLLQAYGWAVLIRRMFWPAIFGSLWIVYFLLLNGPVGGPKYRLPLEPVLILFQSVAIVELASNLRRFSNRPR